MKPWTIVACAGLAISLFSDRAAFAGDLNPPPGAITSTMKPLDAIEPRTCVNDLPGDEGATHRITQPGIYVFSRDIVGENAKDGLRIDCDAFPPGEHTVAIMMQGFALTGVQGAANAIFVQNSDPTTRRVHITISGSLRDAHDNATPGSLITGWSIDGVHVEGATSVSVEGLRVSDCLGDGFEATSPPATGTAVRCYTSVFSNSGQNGVTVTLPAGGASSLEIQEVQCLNNRAHGARILYAASATGVTGKTRIRMESMDASHNSLDGLRISFNGDESISMDADDLFTSNNGGDGTRLSVDRNTSADMSVDFIRCSSSGNVGDGFSFFVTNDSLNSGNNLNWDFCSASRNGGSGFACDASAAPAGASHTFLWNSCAATGNGADGIAVTRVESLRVSSTNASGNTGNGVSIADLDRDGRLDSVRASGNGGGGVVVVSGGTFGISNSACNGNGTGPTGGSGLACDNTVVCQCTHLIANDNTGDGASFTSCSRVRSQSCDFTNNDLDGLRCTAASSCHISSSSASGNTGNGVTVADLNGDGRLDVVVCSSNGGGGIVFDSPLGLACGTASLHRCVTNDNSLSGVDLSCTVGGEIRRCQSSNNGANGFLVSGLGHVVIENTASSNLAGSFIVPVPGNTLGPLTDEAKTATNTNPAANYVR